MCLLLLVHLKLELLDYKNQCPGKDVYQTMEQFVKQETRKVYLMLEMTEYRIISDICL